MSKADTNALESALIALYREYPETTGNEAYDFINANWNRLNATRSQVTYRTTLLRKKGRIAPSKFHKNRGDKPEHLPSLVDALQELEDAKEQMDVAETRYLSAVETAKKVLHEKLPEELRSSVQIEPNGISSVFRADIPREVPRSGMVDVRS
jgi:hypothetical protein